jgi:hypothetical protein
VEQEPQTKGTKVVMALATMRAALAVAVLVRWVKITKA